MQSLCLAGLHSDSHLRREEVKDILTQTIHTINTVKDVVPGELGRGILGTTSSILAIVRVSGEYPYRLPNYMTNDVGQDTIKNKEDCNELIDKCKWVGDTMKDVASQDASQGGTSAQLKKTLQELDK